jgi:5-methylcytosine-specific restriction endonuclease McrA
MSCQQVRLQVLERDKYECQRCGLNFPIFDVHHFKRVTYYSDPQDLNNLMTLCRKCHKIVEGDKHRLDKLLGHIGLRCLAINYTATKS